MLLTKIQTYLRLGLANILRVAVYRLGLRTGLHPVVRVKRKIGGERFFRGVESPTGLTPSRAWEKDALYFGWYTVPLGDEPPDWHGNPFTGKRVERAELPWGKLPDFELGAGDIKCVWEASRFDWVISNAQRAAAGDGSSLERLNKWIADWCKNNPAYLGPNWKCGQEASIRVIHLAAAAMILGQQDNPEPDLARLVEAHLARIFPTLSYAVAQDNNHGTSEAAALFIGGTWLAEKGVVRAGKWANRGRKYLENRVKKLVEPDGCFSQYSVNYHRLMLDTICFAEIWRFRNKLREFSLFFYKRAQAATRWLHAMVEPESGDAPNLGSNDGARILPMTDTDYRDLRPIVQAAAAVFYGRKAFAGEGKYNLHLKWLGLKIPEKQMPSRGSVQFDSGGYAVLQKGVMKAILRYPRYRFRPGHCDALHVDLWHGSNNLLRDSGTFSYNTQEKWLTYFPGTLAHNTVEFDGRDQMPGLGRFLRGKWLEARDVEPLEEKKGLITFGAGYQDWKGAFHHRRITLTEGRMTVADRIGGFDETAVLRWRLAPGKWRLDGTTVHCNGYSLEVSASVPIERCQIVDGWESRYYMKKSALPVLEIEVSRSGQITTELTVCQA